MGRRKLSSFHNLLPKPKVINVSPLPIYSLGEYCSNRPPNRLLPPFQLLGYRDILPVLPNNKVINQVHVEVYLCVSYNNRVQSERSKKASPCRSIVHAMYRALILSWQQMLPCRVSLNWILPDTTKNL